MLEKLVVYLSLPSKYTEQDSSGSPMSIPSHDGMCKGAVAIQLFRFGLRPVLLSPPC